VIVVQHALNNDVLFILINFFSVFFRFGYDKCISGSILQI